MPLAAEEEEGTEEIIRRCHYCNEPISWSTDICCACGQWQGTH